MTQAHPPQHPSAFWRLWRWPIVLGLMIAVGLVSALFSDHGAGDMLAWVMLGIPTAICFWYGWGRRRSAAAKATSDAP